MSKDSLILMERSKKWIVFSSDGAAADVDADLPASAIAERVAQSAVQRDLSRGIVVLLETQSVFFLELDALGSKLNETTLRYAAEAKLPIDAENLVVDLLPMRSKSQSPSRAVVVDSSVFNELTDALQAKKIVIKAIVPESLASLSYWSEQGLLQFPCLVMWTCEHQVEVCQLDAFGQLCEWYLASDSTIPQRLAPFTGLDRAEALTVYVCPKDASSPHPLGNLFPTATELGQQTPDQLLAFAEGIVFKNRLPWVNLAKPPLVGRDSLSQSSQPMARLAIAIGCFFLALCGWLLAGLLKDQSAVAQADQELRRMYATLHPNSRVPATVARRLQSEHREWLARSKGMPGESGSVEAIQVLGDLVSSLRDDWPFEIEEIRIDQSKVFLQCAFVQQEDAGNFVAALEQKGFDCEPPSITLRSDNRFLATILGSIRRTVAK